MRETSNPVFRSLPKDRGGYAQFGTGVAGTAQQMQLGHADPYAADRAVGRPVTIDDVVTKTGITLGVIAVVAAISYFLVAQNPTLAAPFTMIGGLGGLALVLIASFGRRQDNKTLVLSYAALEGLFIGAVSFLLTFSVQGVNAGMLIGQAILGTFGVFFGMLVVYKTGAIRVTPKFTRMVFAALVGALVLMIGDAVLSWLNVGGGDGLGVRTPSALGIVFSLACIAIAAFVFLIDFDAADQMVRAGAPEKAAWGIALGLAVTLVWLYIEILRLLSYLYAQD